MHVWHFNLLNCSLVAYPDLHASRVDTDTTKLNLRVLLWCYSYLIKHVSVLLVCLLNFTKSFDSHFVFVWPCRFFYASSACIYPEFKQLETNVSLKEADAWPAEVS